MRKTLFTILSTLVLFSLAACQLTPEENRTGEKVSITQTITRVISRDDEGEVVESEKIEVTEDFFINPKKVVTFNLGVADIFLYVGLDNLGITKFGIPKNGKPLAESLKEFDDRKYSDVGTLFIPNYDVLDLFGPELIILDGRTSTEYESLKSRYPNADILDLSLTTYEFSKHKENLEILSKIFPNIKEELDLVIDDFEEQFEAIAKKTSDYRLLFVQLNGNIISVATGSSGRYGLVYKEFGFMPADLSAADKSENDHGTMGANLEYIKLIDPEVIFVMDRNMVVNNEPSQDFTLEPLIRGVSAILNNHVYYLDPTSWYTISGGITATYQMIDDVMQFINDI